MSNRRIAKTILNQIKTVEHREFKLAFVLYGNL